MRKGWLVATVGFAILFLVFLVESTRLPMGDELGPGPGFFPLAISVAGLLLAIVLFVSVWRSQRDLKLDAIPFSGLRKVISVVLLVAIAAFALETLGYTLTMLFLVPTMLLILGARSPLGIGIVSLMMSFGVFHVFYFWLNVALPVGIVGI